LKRRGGATSIYVGALEVVWGAGSDHTV
jgi:hypothetical protein